MCGKPDFNMSAVELAEPLKSSIMQLMQLLELKYACIDLAVDLDGMAYFLEINSGGQFLFVDDYIPEFNLLGAFSAMLSAGSSCFELPADPGINVTAFERSEAFAQFTAKQRILKISDRFITQV
jgi:hypothetical protein